MGLPQFTLNVPHVLGVGFEGRLKSSRFEFVRGGISRSTLWSSLVRDEKEVKALRQLTVAGLLVRLYPTITPCMHGPPQPVQFDYHDSESFSMTSFLARTLEQSSQRSLSGSIVSL